ncbi:hypothetical protein E2562_006952 [Oryza meyeriana var. granulata]|uniref:Uncharacterized protein n=1 Tax=Oryza meyeriana var. granulata TaxID=110450 RepID=A0A6G1E9N6_9ORYZ|nr:hypothetical protein E2562_006952 [Oryza meyeriana var. granulata]
MPPFLAPLPRMKLLVVPTHAPLASSTRSWAPEGRQEGRDQGLTERTAIVAMAIAVVLPSSSCLRFSILFLQVIA